MYVGRDSEESDAALLCMFGTCLGPKERAENLPEGGCDGGVAGYEQYSSCCGGDTKTALVLCDASSRKIENDSMQVYGKIRMQGKTLEDVKLRV